MINWFNALLLLLLLLLLLVNNSCVVTLLQLCGHIATAVWPHYYSCVVTLLQLWTKVQTLFFNQTDYIDH